MYNFNDFQYLQGKILEVYDDTDLTKFDVGKLISYNESWILLEGYNKEGVFDGYILQKIENIFKISYNTQYILTLNLSLQDKTTEIRIETFMENIIKSKHRVSIITVNGDVLYGTIINKTDDCIFIENIDPTGISDGETILQNDLICRYEIDAKEV